MDLVLGKPLGGSFNPPDVNIFTFRVHASAEMPIRIQFYKRACGRLLAKVYEIDPFVCPKCGSDMKVIAIIEDPQEIRRILRHLVRIERSPPGLDPASVKGISGKNTNRSAFKRMMTDLQIENRIHELTKTNSDIVRQTIEKSIIKFEELKKENEEKRLYVNHTIQGLKKLLFNDENLFADYSSRVREVLDLQPTNMEDGSIRVPENQKMAPETLKNAFKDLLASLILEETAVKIALSCVNKKALCSSVFASAPPHGLEPRTWWLTATRSTN